MKGIVFREFLEMVEESFGMNVADRIIQESELPSGGAYTSVATYDHREILTLVGKLHEQTQVPVPDLVRAFGRHLFHRFVALYPGFFVGVPSAFAFLQRIDGIIHVEVRKLYPDAELPAFDCEPLGSDRLAMIYRSQRPFVELAEGPRIMSRIVGVDASSVHIGLKVEARIEVPDFGMLKGGDQPAVLFEPLREGDQS